MIFRIHRASYPNSILFVAQEPRGVGTAPIAYYNRLLTRKEWMKFAASTNEFYASITDAEIEYAINNPKEPFELECSPELDTVTESKPLPGYVYVLSGGGYYKIGFSKHVNVRVKQISPKLPFDVKLVCTIETDDMVRAEAYLHGKYASKRAKGEWFALTDEDLEWLLDTDALIYSDGYDAIKK